VSNGLTLSGIKSIEIHAMILENEGWSLAGCCYC